MADATRELFWKRALGLYRPDDAVAWALDRIVELAATPNLAALAGWVGEPDAAAVEDLLRRALAEVGTPEPRREVAYRDFLWAHVAGLLEGALDAEVGCRALAAGFVADRRRLELEPFGRLDRGRERLAAAAPQWDYDGLTLGNFEGLVRFEARELAERLLEDETRPRSVAHRFR